MKKIPFIVILLLSFIQNIFGQTVLASKDIIIVTVNSGPLKSFDFVPLVDLDSGTVINFTDNAWDGSALKSNEGIIIYTAPSPITSGTVISYSDSIGGAWSSSGYFNPARGGDNILVYQGSASSPAFLYGIGWAQTTTWIATGIVTTNNSYIPSTLSIAAKTIVSLGNSDNGQYNTSNGTIGTKTELLALIFETTNWNTDDSTAYSALSAIFTINPDSSPLISAAPLSLTNLAYVSGSGPSDEQSFSISGSNLTADISLAPPTNYEISTGTGGSFLATNPITLSESDGSVAETTIYTRLKSDLNIGAYSNEEITASSSGADDKTIFLSGAVTPDLVITEIMQDPDSVSDSNGEWFEIYNAELTTVNIDGYKIMDNGSNAHTINSDGGILNISAGGFIVLGANADTGTNGGVTLDYEYASFTLTNTDDEVILVYTDGTTIVDKVEYDGGPNFPSPTGASMILINLSADNNIGANWSTSTKREGNWGIGEGDYGSPGVIGSEAVVPVELISFTANLTEAGVVLNWTTATEVNNYGFSIERKFIIGNSKWEEVGFIEGHGNSYSPKVYSFVDNSTISGNVNYRLKQIDTDGGFKYSNIVTVTAYIVTVAAQFVKTELFQNHPNPFNPSTQISFSIANKGRVSIFVYNVLGEKVAELVNKNMDVGIYNVEFNANNFVSGLYFCRLETPKYSKTMKMMLLR